MPKRAEPVDLSLTGVRFLQVRDILAAHALTGLVSAKPWQPIGDNVQFYATVAYQLADAMLEARKSHA